MGGIVFQRSDDDTQVIADMMFGAVETVVEPDERVKVGVNKCGLWPSRAKKNLRHRTHRMVDWPAGATPFSACRQRPPLV